ncbi:MAG: hypothetical protein U5L08_04425 [Xanthomonadales bacterium]|nr:hypothetical protein [Xanthomonadales bacterium]
MGLNPGQLSTISMVGQAGGAFSSAVGSYYGAKSQQTQLDLQADLSDVNSRIAELGAQSVLRQGQREVGRVTMQAGQLKSRQRASMAANGVDLTEGSAAELQASTDIMKEIDASTVESNAIRSAWGYRTQAVSQQNQALGDRATAGSISPFGNAASSLLTSATGLASSWYDYKRMQEG